MKDFKIMNNKLYSNGVPVQLEIGNKEQIDFLKEMRSIRKQFKEGGIEVQNESATNSVGAIFELHFKCICGMNISLTHEILTEDEDFTDTFVGVRTSCLNCNKKFKIVEPDGVNRVDVVKIKLA
jgi:hypothetical protein